MRAFPCTGTWLLALVTASVASAQNTQDRPLSLHVREEYRVGGANAPEWAALVDVRGAAFGAAGDLWLVDTRGRQILRVASDGRTGESRLRRGRGPGEIQMPDGLVVLPDGRLLVSDILNANLQLLGRDGKLVTGARKSGYLRSTYIAWLDGDDFIAVPSIFFVDGQARIFTSEGATTVTRVPLLRVTLQRELQVRTITTLPYSQPPRPTQPFASHAFQPAVRWSAHSGRIALADGIGYDIRVLDGTGKEIGRIIRPINARAASRADIAAAREEARSKLVAPDGTIRVAGAASEGGAGDARNASDVRRRIEAGLDAMTFGERVPVVLDIRYDANGRLWVARTAAVWGQPPSLDVFAPNGTYLGTTHAFPRIPDAFGNDGRAAFIEKDDMDVPYVRVLRFTIAQ